MDAEGIGQDVDVPLEFIENVGVHFGIAVAVVVFEMRREVDQFGAAAAVDSRCFIVAASDEAAE